ncbi:MAG: PPC domain-containing protein [Chloroflexi bacterium]|nr:PPC domain-containing protein [Chloroflexota bacterium]
MRRRLMRGPRTLLAFTLGLALLSAFAAACGDDSPDSTDTQQAEQTQQADQAAAATQTEQQAQPIDAAEQQSESQPDQQAAPAQEQAEPQQSEAAEQDAPEQGQESQTEQPVSDPDRDTLLDGELFASTIGPDETERTFRFQAAASAWLRIFVDGKDGMDPVVTLLDPEGVEIAVNDDLSTTNRDSLLIAQVPTEGLQFIRVQPFDSNSRGDFIIQAQTITIGADDDNAIIAVGSSADGRLNAPGDVDVFEFQVEQGQQVFVLVDGDTGVDVFAQLFQPSGDLLQIDDDGGHGLDSEIYFTADEAGLWRLEVWPASNKVGQRQLIGAYRVTVETGLPTNAVNEAVAGDLAAAALTFLEALRGGDTLTILALAGPEALTIWGWDNADDVGRDVQKIQSIDLGGEILQSVAFGDVLHSARGRVYFQFSEDDWMRFELIQLGGRWLVDDWAHSIGPPS